MQSASSASAFFSWALTTSAACLSYCFCPSSFFSFTSPATPAIYTLSLHDALPILSFYSNLNARKAPVGCFFHFSNLERSEEHTSELQSRFDLVCRLLLEKKKATWQCHACSSCWVLPAPAWAAPPARRQDNLPTRLS